MVRYFKALLFAGLCCATRSIGLYAQDFVIEGRLPDIRDGVEVALISDENAEPKTLAEAVVSGGSFRLQCRLAHPQRCTLITNNLSLVERNGWPVDSVCWTYTTMFADNVPMRVNASRYADMVQDWAWTPAFSIEGDGAQADFNEYNRLLYERSGGDRERAAELDSALQWEFIGTHPHSVVSAYFANGLLMRGYRLTAEEVERLASSIAEVPGDTARYGLFRRRIEAARRTVTGGALVDMEMADENGNICMLSKAVGETRLVLVDFWASWCGICLAAVPKIRELYDQYKQDGFEVIGVSCDKDEKAWRNAMERNKMPWRQYRLTESGYDCLFSLYRVGNGVPYYLLVTSDGRVLQAPERIEDVCAAVKGYLASPETGRAR